MYVRYVRYYVKKKISLLTIIPGFRLFNNNVPHIILSVPCQPDLSCELAF